MDKRISLTKTTLTEGVWEGVLSAEGGFDGRPKIAVTHHEKPVQGVEMTHDKSAGHWVLRVPIPAEVISDGVQTFVIQESQTGETLNSFSLIAGEALGDDLRAEMDLLRAELDMLKRAFRRHCLETM